MDFLKGNLFKKYTEQKNAEYTAKQAALADSEAKKAIETEKRKMDKIADWLPMKVKGLLSGITGALGDFAKFTGNLSSPRDDWEKLQELGAMGLGNSDFSAEIIRNKQKQMQERRSNQQGPSAATYGSSAAAETINNAINSLMGGGKVTVQEAMNELKKENTKMLEELKEIRKGTDTFKDTKEARF
jgi:hypothetical protein